MKCADFTTFNNIFKYCQWWRNILFYIIFLKSHFRNFIQLRKTWPLFSHPNRWTDFMVNHIEFFMTTSRLNLVKKNDVTLPRKYGNFTRPEFRSIFACLVSVSATTSVYWISSKSINFYYFGPPYWIRNYLFSNCQLRFVISDIKKILSTNNIIQDLVTICILVGYIRTDISYSFIYFQFSFVISIFKNLQFPNIKYIRSKERWTSKFQKHIMKHHNSISAQ